MSVLDPRHVWGDFVNQKTFFRESDNSGGDHYNTYASFIKDSKTDSSLKKFVYHEPFTFIPSYGSSVTIEFQNNELEYGNKYRTAEPSLFNRIAVNFELNFSDRSDDQAKAITDFLERKQSSVFVMQPRSYDEVGEEKFKSLYSLDPYFLQEFRCFQYSLNEEYVDQNSISANFANQDFSELTLKYLLYSNSMSEKRKEIFEEYFYKDRLDILPSYTVSTDASFHTVNYSLGKSRSEFGPDGIYSKTDNIILNYENLTDLDAYKIICLVAGKYGFETFKFTTQKPDLRTLNFRCSSIRHEFVYKDTNNIQLNLTEEKIKKFLK